MEGLVNPDFWRGRRVLVTGHTGFKGSWLCAWLGEIGAQVFGFALAPVKASLFEGLRLAERMDSTCADITDHDQLQAIINRVQPEVILHLAAQSLVREGYQSPHRTFATNVMGTVNLLECLRTVTRPCSVVIVTSDKCYENREQSVAFVETDRLGGNDPYSASKAAAEIVTHSYRTSFFQNANVRLATARAGNVIGGGDWAADRLIPDLVRSWLQNRPLLVRSPDAIRPWQHVLDPLNGYLLLAEKLANNTVASSSFNFGPAESEALNVREILGLTQTRWPDVGIEIQCAEQPREAGLLILSARLAATELGWKPKLDVRAAVSATLDWYQGWRDGKDQMAMTLEQIGSFQRD